MTLYTHILRDICFHLNDGTTVADAEGTWARAQKTVPLGVQIHAHTKGGRYLLELEYCYEGIDGTFTVRVSSLSDLASVYLNGKVVRDTSGPEFEVAAKAVATCFLRRRGAAYALLCAHATLPEEKSDVADKTSSTQYVIAFEKNSWESAMWCTAWPYTDKTAPMIEKVRGQLASFESNVFADWATYFGKRFKATGSRSILDQEYPGTCSWFGLLPGGKWSEASVRSMEEDPNNVCTFHGKIFQVDKGSEDDILRLCHEVLAIPKLEDFITSFHKTALRSDGAESSDDEEEEETRDGDAPEIQDDAPGSDIEEQ